MSCIPVRVALRCRPFVSQEKCDGCQPCLQFIPNEPQVVLGSKKPFTFDYAFSEEASQAEVFNKSVLPLIDNVFKGYNVTVMAYGQTGSGKTYTMGTVFSPTISNDMDKIGIIPRTIKELFDGMNARNESRFNLKASFLEIYKEEVIDLLNKSGREEIIIRDDTTGVKMIGIYEKVVNTCEEVLDCLKQGSLMRTTGNTAMNSHSSRSHAIFTLQIENANDNVHSKFHFVDLAGSERAKKTKAEGERLKEGITINLGLLALGNVICALCEGDSRNHVPYRESKLTRLLQDSLGGSSHTVMIACVGPADYNMEETLNTLRYAHRTRKIKNKPIVNQNPQAMEIARLRLLVQKLQGQTNNGINEGEENGQPINNAELDVAKERILQLELENENLNRELLNAIDQTTDLYEKAFLAEKARDKIKQKLEELRQKTGITLNSFNQSLDPDNSKLHEHLKQIQELHETVSNIQEVQVKLELNAGIADSSDPNVTFEVAGTNMTNETYDATTDEHSSERRAEMNRQLQALNKALALKEELAAKLLNNGDQFGALKDQYEKNMKELEKEVNMLQHEKEELSHALRTAQSNSNNKISEQRRQRLMELESQLSELKKKMTEYQRMASMKATSDKEIAKLNREIHDMKHQRVQLVRQMKQESEQMRKYKLDKEREVNHLKQQEQKRRMELTKKQQQFEREQNVSKRRLEQAAAVNKRLKEALLRQKSSSDKRDKEKEKAGTEKVRNLVDQELELVMSIWEAKYHLEMLVEERRQLSEQIQRLRLDESSSDSSCNESSIMSPSKKLSRINQLEMDMEMRQIQINEIQQKLLDADQEERKKMRWAGVQLMSEAKTGLRYLFDLVAANKQEVTAAQNNNQDLVKQSETNFKLIKSMKKELGELRFSHDEEMVQLRKQYEDQIYLIMTAKQNEESVKSSANTSMTSGTSSLITAPEEPLQNDTFNKPVTKAEKKDRRLTKKLVLESDNEMTSDDEKAKQSDPDWTHTPWMRRIALMKAKPMHQIDLNLSDAENIENEPVVIRGKKRKSDEKGCGCRSGCSQKRCKCFKKDKPCDDFCNCGSVCTNRRNGNSTVTNFNYKVLIDS